MRDFDYAVAPVRLLTPEMVQMLGRIHEYKGRQDILLNFYKEGDRLPADIEKCEDVDYVNVYRLVCSNYESIMPTPREFLQIHRKLSASKRKTARPASSAPEDDGTFDLRAMLKNKAQSSSIERSGANPGMADGNLVSQASAGSRQSAPVSAPASVSVSAPVSASTPASASGSTPASASGSTPASAGASQRVTTSPSAVSPPSRSSLTGSVRNASVQSLFLTEKMMEDTNSQDAKYSGDKSRYLIHGSDISSDENDLSIDESELPGFRKAGEQRPGLAHMHSAYLQRSGLRFRDTLQRARSSGIERVSTASEMDPEEAIDNLCDEFMLAWEEDRIDKLILIPMFFTDLMCIQPFDSGNEKFSWIIAQLLLLRAGYKIGKYVSLDSQIEKSRLTYTNVLQASSEGWEEERNNYSMFAAYFLSLVGQAYTEFEDSLKIPGEKKQKKPDRIRELIDARNTQITKKEIMQMFPDISKVTVERALTDLVKSGYIVKVGAGPSTAYIKVDKASN